MMSDGFIMRADFQVADEGTDRTDLHVEDLNIGAGTVDDDDSIVGIWFAEEDTWFRFTRHEANQLVEAVQEIVNRHPAPVPTDAVERGEIH